MIHIRMIYGQGGKGVFSLDFIALKDRLQQMGHLVSDDITWDHPDGIIADIWHRRKLGHREVLWGYSMGAVCTAWVASAGQPIDLICAVDPSAGYWPFTAAAPNPIGKNVKRCLCFVHIHPEPIVSAPFTGNAEVIPIDDGHAWMAGNKKVQHMMLAALADMEKS